MIFFQPLLPEVKLAPLTKYFDIVKNNMNIGILAIAAMAIMAPSSVCVSAVNFVIYRGIVFISSLCAIRRGHKRLSR